MAKLSESSVNGQNLGQLSRTIQDATPWRASSGREVSRSQPPSRLELSPRGLVASLVLLPQLGDEERRRSRRARLEAERVRDGALLARRAAQLGDGPHLGRRLVTQE
eukprot:1599442-Pleurochrysis_carterae.AAC.2